MTHIGHLFDGSAGCEQRVGISQLIDGLPRDRYVNSLATIDPAAATSLRWLARLSHDGDFSIGIVGCVVQTFALPSIESGERGFKVRKLG